MRRSGMTGWFAACIGLLLVTACGGAPTAMEVAVVPTASATFAPSATSTATPTATWTPTPTFTSTQTATPTPRATLTSTSTPTLTPTHTPTASKTPQPTNTSTSTPTRTPKATPTATATPKPVYVWTSDLDNKGWENFFKWPDAPESHEVYCRLAFKGASADLIPDPTGSGHGIVFSAWTEGPPVLEGDEYLRRAHPGIWFPFQGGPYSSSVDVYIYGDIKSEPVGLGPDHPFVNLLSAFDRTKIMDGEYHVAWVVNIADMDGVLRLEMRAFDKDMQSTGPANGCVRYPNAPAFSWDRWINVRVDILGDARMVLYQDGIPVCHGRLPDTTRLGLIGGHTGLYTGPVDYMRMLWDNFTYVVYPAQ